MKQRNKIIITIIGIGVIAFLVRHLGLIKYIKIENIAQVKNLIEGFGIWGPIIYLFLYIAACLFFLPGLPITLLGGLAFGPVWGTVWTSIASIGGATASFLVSRYVARDMIEDKFGHNHQFKKIENGFKKHGWRMLVITRMVPVFPFNLQNYLYGLTNIKLVTYISISWICMLPATIAYCFAAGSIVKGTKNIKSTFIYLGIAAVFFVIVSFLPRLIKKKQKDIFD